MENTMIDLRKGDCLEVMDKLIEEGVVVDAIITDPPYGTTACKWDSIIPFDEMWERLNRLIKPNGAIVLFGSEPFSSALRMSNIKNYKYDWVWEKSRPTGHLNAKKQPMRKTEILSVFYNTQPTYNAQGLIEGVFDNTRPSKNSKVLGNGVHGKERSDFGKSKYTNYPVNILKFNNEHNVGQNKHPTQKPVALMEYLIKTYTNENELVLDFTMGSGSTGVACKNLGRNFIGIEMDDNYFKIAEERTYINAIDVMVAGSKEAKKIEDGSIYLEIRKLFFIRPSNLDDANDIANKGMKLVEQYAEHMVQQERERITKLINNDNTKQFAGFLVIGTYKEHIIKAINQE